MLLTTARSALRAPFARARGMATASTTIKVHVVRGTVEGRDATPAPQAAYTAEVPHGLKLSELLARVTPESNPGHAWVARAGAQPAAVWSAQDGVRLLPAATDGPVAPETKVDWSYFLGEVPSAWVHARLSQDASLTPAQLEHEFARIATQI